MHSYIYMSIHDAFILAQYMCCMSMYIYSYIHIDVPPSYIPFVTDPFSFVFNTTCISRCHCNCSFEFGRNILNPDRMMGHKREWIMAHTRVWVTAHTREGDMVRQRRSHDTRTNQSCHTRVNRTLHFHTQTSSSHAAHMWESWCNMEWVVAQFWMSGGTILNESWCTNEKKLNELWRTYK